jgi:hypothetical protein
VSEIPLYPFILLAAIFLAVLILPPLVAAFLDYRREAGSRPTGRGPNENLPAERRPEERQQSGRRK